MGLFPTGRCDASRDNCPESPLACQGKAGHFVTAAAVVVRADALVLVALGHAVGEPPGCVGPTRASVGGVEQTRQREPLRQSPPTVRLVPCHDGRMVGGNHAYLYVPPAGRLVGVDGARQVVGERARRRHSPRSASDTGIDRNVVLAIVRRTDRCPILGRQGRPTGQYLHDVQQKGSFCRIFRQRKREL
jgi:hypothetical protein